jgi:Transposase DDE domain group 1
MDQGRQRRDQVDPAVMPLIRRQRRPAPAALAYNLGNFLRTLATPEPIKDWSLTSLKKKLIKIGAKVVSHGRYVAFQMAEVVISRNLFADILRLIADLRPPPVASTA